MSYASWDDILPAANADAAEDFVAPSGRKFRIRSLTRAEAMNPPKGAAAIERYMLVCGLVEPKCTEEQAAQWQAAPVESEAAKDCDAVSTAIMRLSGLLPDATKSRRGGDARRPDAADGRVAGGEAAQDARRDKGDAQQ